MVKNHLKTIAAPKTWPVMRKSKKFILKPSAGPHSLNSSLSLNFLLIDVLKLANTKKEATYIVNNKKILVDKKRRKNITHPVGLFDTISIDDIKKNYRIVLDKKGKFSVVEIDEKESNLKPCKITGKNLVNKKIQLHFFDGTNMLTDSKNFKVGDTLLIDQSKKSTVEHFKLEKGSAIFLIGGKHLGEIGKIEDIVGNKIVYKVGSDEVHETLKKYAFVIGKDKSVLTLLKK